MAMTITVAIIYVSKIRADALEVEIKKFTEKMTPKIRPFCMADFIMFGCIEFVFGFSMQKYKKTLEMKRKF